MGVINDGNQHFASAMDAEGLLHQQPLAVMVPARELDLERFAKDAQGVVVSVERAIDDGCDHSFWVVRQQRLFQNAFAGARFAEKGSDLNIDTPALFACGFVAALGQQIRHVRKRVSS
jgi:hypothetical protein